MSWSLPALWAAVERFAHARGAVPTTFAWNLGQASVVPGPSELLMLPLAIADPERTNVLATVACLGSVLGGCLAYWLGAVAFDPVGRPLLALLGVGDAGIARAIELMARYGWLLIVSSTLTPISSKAIMITAGATGLSFPGFLAALVAGRVLRYTLIVVLLRASAGPMHQLRARLLDRRA